jgi:hypothetical protein
MMAASSRLKAVACVLGGIAIQPLRSICSPGQSDNVGILLQVRQSVKHSLFCV